MLLPSQVVTNVQYVTRAQYFTQTSYVTDTRLQYITETQTQIQTRFQTQTQVRTETQFQTQFQTEVKTFALLSIFIVCFGGQIGMIGNATYIFFILEGIVKISVNYDEMRKYAN